MVTLQFLVLIFFYVGLALEDIFFDPIYGLYFSHQHTYQETNTQKTYKIEGFSIHINGTMSQAGIDPPGQSHASYNASALPPSHQGWIVLILDISRADQGCKRSFCSFFVSVQFGYNVFFEILNSPFWQFLALSCLLCAPILQCFDVDNNFFGNFLCLGVGCSIWVPAL